MLRSKRIRDERGQALPFVILALIVLIGFASLAIDLGRVWVAKQQLQQAVDASATAAGQYLPSSTDAYSAAVLYSGTGGKNRVGGWGVSVQAPSVTFKCVANGPNYTSGTCPADTSTTSGSNNNCHPLGANPVPGGATTCNAVTVTESATVSNGFMSLFLPKFTINASSTSGARDNKSVPNPLNVVVVLDTTQSMSQGCNAQVAISPTKNIPSANKLDCAKAGVRALLQVMPYSVVNGASVADDYVGMVVFPAISATLSSSSNTTPQQEGPFTGTFKKNSASITGIASSANLAQYEGDSNDSISGTYVASGATITSITKVGTTYTVTMNKNSTAPSTTGNSGTFTFNHPVTTTTYSMPTTPPISPPGQETDCKQPSTTQPTSSTYDHVSNTFTTYPPWQQYTNAPTLTGGLPSSVLGNFTNYGNPASGVVDNFPGYTAVPLLGDYQKSDGTLNTNSYDVQSVYWSQCSGGTYPNHDYYGLKDFPEYGVTGQGSYLAGAISEAQYMLGQSTRTTGPTGQAVTNAIIILSDGELDQPDPTNPDGVDPGAAGNITWGTNSTPCKDAVNAAQQAQADKTLIFTIAYDSSGECDSNNYNNDGRYSAQSLMQALASPTVGSTKYYYSQTDSQSLVGAFETAAETLSPGISRLIPDCGAGVAPPAC